MGGGGEMGGDGGRWEGERGGEMEGEGGEGERGGERGREIK